MKEIFKSNKLNFLNKFTQSSFLKAKFALFSNQAQRTLELEKIEQINDTLKHKNFVIKKFKFNSNQLDSKTFGTEQPRS
jgi:hypothetical protein